MGKMARRGAHYSPAPVDDRRNAAPQRPSPTPDSSRAISPHQYSKRRRIGDDSYRNERADVAWFGRGESYRPGRDKQAVNDGAKSYENVRPGWAHYGRTGSYRPDSRAPRSHAEYDRPRYSARPADASSSKESRHLDGAREHRNRPVQFGPPPPRSQAVPKHKDHEAVTKGLSTKIHSLKNLLSHANSKLPADVRQEKERELAGYLADQQAAQARRNKNDILSRYHFVRFLERKKAGKKLQGLMRRQQTEQPHKISEQTMEGADEAATSDDDDEGGVQLETNAGTDDKLVGTSLEAQPSEPADQLAKQIHNAEVDLNYTLFSPLDQKYISIFAGRPYVPGRRKGDSPAEVLKDIEAGVFRNASGEKPPLWYEVEKCMADGTLEALRDGRLGPGLGAPLATTTSLPSIGGPRARKQEQSKSSPGTGQKRGSSWMEEDEPMQEQDLDSDESDGDFFER